MGIEKIRDYGIIAIIRGHHPQSIPLIVEALKKGGIRTVEITMDTPKVCSVIEQVVDEFGDEMLIGAGTVLDRESARLAILAGAKFIFSPSLDIETIRMTKRYGAVSIPGAFTPTEILAAYEHGADAVKVFPANILGPAYIKSVRDPLPQIPIIPTGGVSLENVGDYFKNGAFAVGLGGALVHKTNHVDEEYLQIITQKATRFVEEVKKARQ
ncbi:bifunctional 4-hydroxy-2-oxoglutarate aldolase/2-dehydro-3-deoxy-phosphogluconate aldolase [Thermoflavimicrobium dichotomicum]|uniref:2-dehydro-3-deoxyphosphogluconate aldolase / (4S)-4-hydroxy-2-oxoglutarate aldolase n=1 Tax=Thermoflavimicrobium dichotomicum TaxID=46223 RepID=A0A1I3P871_9BACL|nr:bifunctional 4-hydroxy-2-oxoglutarate aldolase/2-dehydro-3-deoxy-phosphogluconate aldolase [Thermoflavimicrobium dichotomicum]SFJ17601.1 2-dehydro-3-deoxyphosphogluconate aldolase / (4S)-4-hydroxy-2-oxoglutarate aldolase [Thermoflavimicrobium dichotomicum]